MRKFITIITIIAAAALTAPCSSGNVASDGPVTELSTLEGTRVPVGSSLTYTFPAGVDFSTVTSSTFYLNAVPTTTTRAVDETLCNPAAAIDAIVGCISSTVCVLDPIATLTGDTNFIVCLTSGIINLDGTPFEGISHLFTTDAGLSTNSVECAADAECTSGFCIDGTCCDTVCADACFECSTGTCAAVTGADDVSECTDDNTCDANGVCKKVNGIAATSTDECASGFVKEGVCCDTACTEPCKECSTGTCSAVVSAVDESECTGNSTCDENGACVSVQGETCTEASDCLSGFCKDGVCCDTACTADCYNCAQEGSVGTCTVVIGIADPPECAAPDFCSGGAAVKGIKRIAFEPGTCIRPE